jgi:hypothetical protein
MIVGSAPRSEIQKNVRGKKHFAELEAIRRNDDRDQCNDGDGNNLPAPTVRLHVNKRTTKGTREYNNFRFALVPVWSKKSCVGLNSSKLTAMVSGFRHVLD